MAIVMIELTLGDLRALNRGEAVAVAVPDVELRIIPPRDDAQPVPVVASPPPLDRVGQTPAEAAAHEAKWGGRRTVGAEVARA